MAVAFVDSATALADPGTSATTPSITVDESYLYIAVAAWGNYYPEISSISGLGLTWNLMAGHPLVVPASINEDSSCKLAVWIGSGTPSDGTVTFTADISEEMAFAVFWLSGANLSTPVNDTDQDAATVFDDHDFSGSMTGNAGGYALTIASVNRAGQDNTDGFTNVVDLRTGIGPGDAAIKVNGLPLFADGTVNYSGTITFTNAWFEVQALTIMPFGASMMFAPGIKPGLQNSLTSGISAGIK